MIRVPSHILCPLLGAIFLIGSGPFTYAQESGSVERTFPLPRFGNLPGGESGSVEKSRFPRGILPIEAGSVEKSRFPIPQDILPGEAGSGEKPASVIPGKSKSSSQETGSREKAGSNDTTGNQDSMPASDEADVEPFFAEDLDPEFGHIFLMIIVAILVFLFGLFLVVWGWFRLGLFNPFTANLWPKRLELCIEIALRIDDFMTAYHEPNFEKCQMALDALNHLNGRRSILLSNDINSAVNGFVQDAVNSRISQNDEAFQQEFHRKYEVVIEALRVGTRQKELSLEVLRSLTKAQGPHREIKTP